MGKYLVRMALVMTGAVLGLAGISIGAGRIFDDGTGFHWWQIVVVAAISFPYWLLVIAGLVWAIGDSPRKFFAEMFKDIS